MWLRNWSRTQRQSQSSTRRQSGGQAPNPTEACGNCVSSLDTRSEQLKRAASQSQSWQAMANNDDSDDVDQVQKNRIQIEHDESWGCCGDWLWLLLATGTGYKWTGLRLKATTTTKATDSKNSKRRFQFQTPNQSPDCEPQSRSCRRRHSRARRSRTKASARPPVNGTQRGTTLSSVAMTVAHAAVVVEAAAVVAATAASRQKKKNRRTLQSSKFDSKIPFVQFWCLNPRPRSAFFGIDLSFNFIG